MTLSLRCFLKRAERETLDRSRVKHQLSGMARKLFLLGINPENGTKEFRIDRGTKSVFNKVS